MTVVKYFPRKLQAMLLERKYLEKPIPMQFAFDFIWKEYQRLVKETTENLSKRVVQMKGMFPVHTLEEFIYHFALMSKHRPEGLKTMTRPKTSKQNFDWSTIFQWTWRTALICKSIHIYAKTYNIKSFETDLLKLRDKRPFFYEKLRKTFAKKNIDLSFTNWESMTFMVEVFNRYLGYLEEIHNASNYLRFDYRNYWKYALKIWNSRNIPLPPILYMNFAQVFGLNMIILAVELTFYHKKRIPHSSKDMFCSIWMYKNYLDEVGHDGDIYFDVLVNLFVDLQKKYIEAREMLNAEFIVYLFPKRPEFVSFDDPKHKIIIEKDIKKVDHHKASFKKYTILKHHDKMTYFTLEDLVNPDLVHDLQIPIIM
jgi:hypothetical protein